MVIGDTAMFVAPPSLRPGKGRYRWVHGNVPIANAPAWLIERVTATEASDADSPNEELVASDFNMLAFAVHKTPNNLPGWEAWKRRMLAFYNAVGGDEETFSKIAHEFGARWTEGDYDADYTDKTIREVCARPPRSSGPRAAGAGTIYRAANEACPDWRTEYEARGYESIRAVRGEEGGDVITPVKKKERKNPLIVDDEPPPLPAGLVVKLSEWAKRDLPLRDLLMGEIISTTTRMMLSADTGIGKTMFAVALGMRASLGLEFLRWNGQRRSRILYIDGEMSRRVLKKRLNEEIERIGTMSNTFFALSREDLPDLLPLDTVKGQRTIEDVIRECCGGQIDLVIFDNIMALISGEMKDEEAWGKVMPWICDLTRRSIGQIWLHHTGHDASRQYGTKTREWQLDLTAHMEKVENLEIDVNFNLQFGKTRERDGDNRDDFAPMLVSLQNNKWKYTRTEARSAAGAVARPPTSRRDQLRLDRRRRRRGLGEAKLPLLPLHWFPRSQFRLQVRRCGFLMATRRSL